MRTHVARLLVRTLFLVAFFSTGATLADVAIRSGSTSDTAFVNSNKALIINEGASARPTYIASASGLATTAAFNMNIEAGSVVGYKVSAICVGLSNATAAAAVSVVVQRRTTASTAGTAMTIEGTATPAISKLDPGAASFAGTGRVTATQGTAGPILDQWGYEVSSGTSSPSFPFCKTYGLNGDQLPTVAAGVNNGISVSVSAPGAGGLAAGSISMTLIQE